MPAFHFLRDELLPQLGTLRHIDCNYSQRSSRYDAYLRGEVLPAFDPDAGGGALMDINIYNLHFAIALLGMPQTAYYHCRHGFNGVDLNGTAILEYPSHPQIPQSPQNPHDSIALLALCTGAKDTNAPSYGLIQGDNGWIRIDGPVSTMTSINLCLNGQQPQQIPILSFCPADTPSTSPLRHRLAPEFAAFADLLHRRDFATMNSLLDHSLAVLQTLDNLFSRF